MDEMDAFLAMLALSVGWDPLSPAYKAARVRENAAAERKSHAATTSGPGTATTRKESRVLTALACAAAPLPSSRACDGPGERGGASA